MNTIGSIVHLECTDDGGVARMWTVGKMYRGLIAGIQGGLIDVVDDLGRWRTMTNAETPSFPMGDNGITSYTARFKRAPQVST